MKIDMNKKQIEPVKKEAEEMNDRLKEFKKEGVIPALPTPMLDSSRNIEAHLADISVELSGIKLILERLVAQK